MSETPVLAFDDVGVHFKIQSGAAPRVKLPRDLPDVARTLYRAIVPERHQVLRAVDGVTLEIAPGETVALVGESGSGKSTLGRAAVKLAEPTFGTVKVNGADLARARGPSLREIRKSVQMVFQDPYASLNPRLTVGEAIAEPLRALKVASGTEVEDRVATLLSRVGLEPVMARRYPLAFSGGQRQRVAIARALGPEPALVVADEAVSALDVSVQAQILELFASLREERNLALLFIAHDLAVVRQLAHRVAVMYLGRLVEVGSVEQVLLQPRHPYTQALVDAVPRPDPTVERTRTLHVLQGEVPSPLDPPHGCTFHPRCPVAAPRCRNERPVLKLGALDRDVACHAAHGEADAD